MSFVSTGNKPAGNGGPVITTPPITGESGDTSTGSAATGIADAAEQMAEQAAAELFGALPEPSGLVKAAVTAAAAGISDIVSAAQDAAALLAAGGPGAHNVTVSGSAVPPQMLLFAGINGSEKLGSLFTYIVQLKTPDTLNLGYVSPAANLPLKPMVGKDLCVNIELDGGGKRHISGLVTAARVVGHEGRSVTYELRMEPWVKLLTHTSDYKAFQTPTEAGQQQHRMQADTVRFEYDRSGWLTAEHAGNGSIRYQRDALGNPTDITLPDGQHLTHLYYGSGHLLQTALDGLTVSEYERDSLHRQIMRTQGQLATYSGYDDDGLLSWQRSLASGSAPVLPGQRPARQGCVTSRDYYWNNHGEVGTIDDSLRGSVVYSYDRSGYLTGRSGQMYDHDRYYYDKAGNLLDNEGQGPVMNNRLPGCGRDRYGYNEWGELTTRRDQQLEWNAQGQLTRVISGNTETHYGYDALGRRVSKATYGRHTGHTARSRTDFVWEGVRLLQENVQQQGWRTYLYDAEQPYTPVASVTGRGESRQVWYYHTDVTGTPQEVTAADGTLVWAGYIRGFGENAADISNSGAYFHQPLRLPGQYFDDETGLHYNLFRYYAPECGRFVSQDPIGLKGGINLYQYAPNPLSWIDQLGLTTEEITLKPGEILVNPKDVNFSQTTINSAFDTPDGKRSVQSVINDVRKGNIKATDFPAIKVVNVKGQLVVRDGNSRLAIAVKGKAQQIKVILETNVDQLRDFTKRLRNNGLPNTGTSKTPTCK
ncbi:contractile injection system protein, VgrG/Pvc8 family [Salmonella enterica subsp. enterica serovar Pomona]